MIGLGKRSGKGGWGLRSIEPKDGGGEAMSSEEGLAVLP